MNEKTCPQCGSPVAADALRCPRCCKLLLAPCSGSCSRCLKKGKCQ